LNSSINVGEKNGQHVKFRDLITRKMQLTWHISATGMSWGFADYKSRAAQCNSCSVWRLTNSIL